MINKERVKALIKKDWRVFFGYKSGWLPMLIVPIIFCIVLPLGFGIGFQFLPEKEIAKREDNLEMIQQIQNSFSIPPKMTTGATFAYIMLVYQLMPMFLIVPIMVASITSAYSIVGEKEGKTIEGLLYTPLSNEELILTKVLSSFIPSFLITLISFIFYSVIVNAVFWGQIHHIAFPTLSWIFMLFLISPLVSFAAICVMVITSSKAKSAIEAQQNSAFLIFPLIILFVGQITGIAYLTPVTILIIVLVIGILDLFLFRFASKGLDREKLAVEV